LTLVSRLYSDNYSGRISDNYQTSDGGTRGRVMVDVKPGAAGGGGLKGQALQRP
jgi:hypothetical protein